MAFTTKSPFIEGQHYKCLLNLIKYEPNVHLQQNREEKCLLRKSPPGAGGQKGEGCQKVQTSSYKINKSRESNIQLDDYS